MPHIHLPPGWQGREQDVTPRDRYENRRSFVKKLGLGAIGAATGLSALAGCVDGSSTRAAAGQDTTGADTTGSIQSARPDGPLATIPEDAPRTGLPAPRNEQFKVERAITDRIKVSSYNNFYEFKNQGDLKDAWLLTGEYDPFPWTIDVRGAVEQEKTIDVDQLISSADLEERVYRFRCVEAWAMTVPWTGFPLRALIEQCQPLQKANYVRFVSADRPKQMPGLAETQQRYPWPYFEALRMDEATNELAFVVTGAFGEPLPKQNGSPLRLALPWKYGYKGPKAFVRMEFTEEQPETFWHKLQPDEYGFFSNVNPNIPAQRWSQATEELIGQGNREVPTKIFNGYGEYVASLYPDEPRQPTEPMAR